jgi:hypothetical protein
LDEGNPAAMKCADAWAASCLPFALWLVACSSKLDAGYDTPHGELPVDERSPLVIVNDGARDNWQGEYAAVLAATGRVQLVGIVVNANAEYPMLDTNLSGYREMIAAGRESGMQNLPDPTASVATVLVKPKGGVIEDTVPNRSEGARLLVQAAKTWGTVAHPLAIATGGALTDVADAWLIDPSIAERVVVVASLGQASGTGARTPDPNGARDAWATVIVVSRLRYVQVNGYYDQLDDIPESREAELPDNAFGKWMAGKRGDILGILHACDQVSVLSAALPWFAEDVTRMSLDATDATVLEADPSGPLWHVGRSDSERARQLLWDSLLDPATYR